MRTDTTPSGEIVYVSGYKEPLRPFEKGYGYLGTLSYNEDKTKVQCHLCGELFVTLAFHLASKHGISATKYRAKIQLAKTTGLTSQVYKETAQQRGAIKGAEWLKKYHFPKGSNGTHNHYHPKSLEKRNVAGTCPDQLLDAIHKTAKSYGHTPTADEFRALYHHKLLGAIKRTFGTWNNALTRAGFTPEFGKRYTRDELLEALVNFSKVHKRLPTALDCIESNGMPSYPMYRRAFGGLPKARKEAGIK